MLTRATLMSPEKDEILVCGNTYTSLFIFVPKFHMGTSYLTFDNRLANGMT